WRRSGLLTDVQFAEMRYTGRPAAFLRGFRAIYLGLLMNCLILGWVTKAMVTIVGTTLGVSPHAALAICIFFLIPFTGLYVSLGGLWGVLWTDLFQFVLKMAIVIAVAYYAVDAVGGLGPLVSTLHHLRTTASTPGGAPAGNALSFFPDFSRPLTSQTLWLLPGLTFVVYLAVQWWAFWYPGAEPGGGGYIAQRIFSAKDERHGLLSVLWFNIAHYAIRPWPWIIAALAAIVLYPHLEHPETGYMLIVNNQMPHALKGVVIAGFMAAFMSTIATQLNWGASYLVADFYRRFIKRNGPENHYVNISRLVTVLLVICSGYVAAQLTSIKSGWEVVLEIGAGTGGVYLLRWYWWRINAWSEISAMATALAVTIALRWGAPFNGQGPVLFAKTAITTTALTTVVWIVVTFLTKPESEEVLLRFYRKARPDVRGWKPVALKTPEVAATRDLGRNLSSWILGCVMVYGALFGIGWLTLGPRWLGGVMMAVAAVAAALLYSNIIHGGWEMQREPAAAPSEARAALPRT
ncbi:MAG TPA: sodium:solute symporter family protein, partial [Terriglobales bacterium]|nr:sodium:solute symporter family protein [Terriglobales bacterium]